MSTQYQSDDAASPLQCAMQQLAELRRGLTSSRMEVPYSPASRERIGQQLDELEQWLDGLIGILGDRRQPRPPSLGQKH